MFIAVISMLTFRFCFLADGGHPLCLVLSSSKMLFYNAHCLSWNFPTIRQTDLSQGRTAAMPVWRSRRLMPPTGRSLREKNYEYKVDHNFHRQTFSEHTILLVPCRILFQRVPL